MRVLYNSRLPAYKQPFGCLMPDQECRIALQVPMDCTAAAVELRLESDKGPYRTIPMTLSGTADPYEWYEARFQLPNCGLYFYHFWIAVETGGFSLYRQGDSDVNMESGGAWQLSVGPGQEDTGAWAGTVFYQVFPDRFCRVGVCDLTEKLQPYRFHDAGWEASSNALGCEDFYGGNFAGIQEKLPYLQELGVEALYLNPVCMAQSSHRYDTADYLRPDPMLGTQADAAALFQAAHDLGMRVILDGVFSHTGSNSRYFDAQRVFGGGAASDTESLYRGWYDFQSWPETYTAWWGMSSLPCLRELEPAVLDFLVTGPESVVRYWLGLGADGFRLDVADELPDAFLQALRQTVHQVKPNALVVGEVWEDASNKVSYDIRRTYLTAGELDGVMNYPFRAGILGFIQGEKNAYDLAYTVMELAEHYPKVVLDRCLVSLGTHDTPRVLTVLTETSGTGATAQDRARAAAILQFFLPGMPCIYYGDEAGLLGGADPDNRRLFPWGRENLELASFYRSLAALHRRNPALKRGDIRCRALDESTFTAVRTWDGKALTLYVYSGAGERSVPKRGTVRFLHRCRETETELILQQSGAAIIECMKDSRRI